MLNPFTTIALSLLTCAAVMAQSGDSIYQIVKHDLPSSVQPGERAVSHITFKCIAPGEEPTCYPAIDVIVNGTNINNSRVSMPWMWHTGYAGPSDAQVVLGENIDQGLFIDVPIDTAPGDGEIRIRVDKKEKGTAKLRDESGKDIDGDLFVWRFKILPRVQVIAPPVVSRMTAPTIDGRVDEAEWKNAGEFPAFLENAAGGPAAVSTRLKMGHDDTNLYMAFVCEETSIAGVKATKLEGRDPAIFENESVELFFDPKADGAGYYHFVSDILGQKYDALGSDTVGYNPLWQAAAQKGSGSWSIEIAIPFTAMTAAAPTAGDAWLANFGRERHAGKSFDLYAWKPTHGSLAAAEHFSTIVFDSLKAYLQKAGDRLSAEAGSWPEDVKKSAVDWSSQLASWQGKVKDSQEVDESAYVVLATTLAGLKKDAEQYRLRALGSAPGGSPFYVTRSWPYVKFEGKNTDLDSKFGPVNLTLLRDEWADVALSITNTTGKSLVVRCSARYEDKEKETNPALGYWLGLPGLETLWQEAVLVAPRGGNPPGWDAIQPVSAGAFRIPAGETTQVWFSVHVPADYKGDTTINGSLCVESVDGTPGKPLSVPMTINVLPQILTKDQPVHGFTWNLLYHQKPGSTPKWLTTAQARPEWNAAHFADLKSHGIDYCMLHSQIILPRPLAKPDGTLEDMDFSRMDAVIEASKDVIPMYYITIDVWNGPKLTPSFIGLDFKDPAYGKAFKSWIKALVGRLKKHGIGYDRFVMNPYDESVSDNCLAVAKLIKEADPNVREVINSIGSVDVIDKFSEYTDVWMPHFNQYQADTNRDSINRMREQKKELWVYWYSQGDNEKNQNPTGHYMFKFWWAFRNDITSVCYWAQQYYGDPWNRAESTEIYDTSLVYPTETGCIPSRRWQAWRQGFQDYCLFDLAREALAGRKDPDGLARLNILIDKAIAIPAEPTNFDAARDFAKQVLGRE